jgi:hypothetical protein
VKDREHDDPLGLDDEEDCVWKSSHEDAPDFAVDAQVREGRGSHALERFLDALHEVVAEPGAARFVPEPRVFELRCGSEAKNDRRRHLRVRVRRASHATTSFGVAA